ncbi:MAG TPA: hypothetical protein VFX96_15655 [Pyrinomonadaceae bacterium]|nr:hypothetical protein [Pyrinomonadaceae bacterium]
MNTNVNLEAAVGVLGLAGSCFALLTLAAVAAHAAWRGRRERARLASAGALAVVALYLWAMMTFSFRSAERVLARGEEKYFCEIDCHLAYSVTGVERRLKVGVAPNAVGARGEFYVVTLRTRFDENTTSPLRGDRPLRPNARSVTVYDERGVGHAPSPEGQRALELAGEAALPLDSPLRPGESFVTRLVFDLPASDAPPGERLLLINESALPTRFIIGHENSLLHGRTKFRLGS